jgi:putative transposase
MIRQISTPRLKGHRFPLSLRDVEDLLAERGIVASYETIYAWVETSGHRS